jgi:hypothetical protein
MMGGGWAINIIAAEWIIRSQRPRPKTIFATVG